MLVTAIEARPLRSLERVRVELEPGHRQRRRAQRGRQDEPGRGALLRPHRPLLPHLRPPRPDPLRRLAGPGRGDGPRRRRARAPAARLGQPQRGPPPPARRQPGRPGDAGPQPPAGGGLRPRPPQPGQGPAGRAPRPPRRLPRRPLAGPRRSCASATARRSPSATRCSRGSPAGYGVRRRTCDVWDAGLAEAAAPLVAARDEAVAELAAPFAAAAAELGLEGGAASSTRRGPRASAEEIRAGLEERREQDLRIGRSSWGPHLDELKLDAGGPLAAPLRLPGPAARRPAGPALRRARGAAAGAPGHPAAAARRRDERARPRPPRAPGRPPRRRRPGR